MAVVCTQYLARPLKNRPGYTGSVLYLLNSTFLTTLAFQIIVLQGLEKGNLQEEEKNERKKSFTNILLGFSCQNQTSLYT